MARVQIIFSGWWTDDRFYEEGEIAELPDETADLLIGMGMARAPRVEERAESAATGNKGEVKHGRSRRTSHAD